MTRRSIDVEGLGHSSLPIPTASRIGPFVATGGIRGVDRTTREMPDDPQVQADLMFDNLRMVIEAAGGGTADILKLTVWIRDASLRPIVNPGWLALFPDPGSRPARHIMVHDLPAGMAIQCEALAVVDAS